MSAYLYRVWEEDDFCLELVYSDRCYSASYWFFHDGELIFHGSNFKPSNLHFPISDRNVANLLAFLSLRPGDCEASYFESYTAKQLTWAIKYGEQLSIYVQELEESDLEDQEFCFEESFDPQLLRANNIVSFQRI